MEAWTCSVSCCRAAVRAAPFRAGRSASRASTPSSGSGLRCASAAGARAPGPSGAASNARAGGWRLHGRAARSSTTLERGPSSPPGRSEAVATSPRRWPRSSPKSSPHPASTCSRSCRVTASAAGSAVTCRPQAWRAALGSRWGLPVECLLSRRDGSKRQAGLLRAERRANVRGAFMSSGSSPRLVAIVDDIYTTGATASACATALRRAGARRVEVVCLARAVR